MVEIQIIYSKFDTISWIIAFHPSIGLRVCRFRHIISDAEELLSDGFDLIVDTSHYYRWLILRGLSTHLPYLKRWTDFISFACLIDLNIWGSLVVDILIISVEFFNTTISFWSLAVFTIFQNAKLFEPFLLIWAVNTCAGSLVTSSNFNFRNIYKLRSDLPWRRLRTLNIVFEILQIEIILRLSVYLWAHLLAKLLARLLILQNFRILRLIWWN